MPILRPAFDVTVMGAGHLLWSAVTYLRRPVAFAGLVLASLAGTFLAIDFGMSAAIAALNPEDFSLFLLTKTGACDILQAMFDRLFN